MNNENFEINYIEDIKKAVESLKNKETLISITKGQKSFFILNKQRVLIVEPNCKYSLSIEEFTTLFKENKFVIKEKESESDYDFSRDDEYYSWQHK